MFKTTVFHLEMEEAEHPSLRRKNLCLEFAKKCLKNEKMKSLLCENENIHQMKTRKREKFKVNHAKTSRLMNSPIIYMQRLLNEQ